MARLKVTRWVHAFALFSLVASLFSLVANPVSAEVIHTEFVLNADGTVPTDNGNFVYTPIPGAELSADPDDPTVVDVRLGDNFIYGSVDNAFQVTFDNSAGLSGDQYDPSSHNIDIFTFNVQPGEIWSSLTVLHYDNPVDEIAFVAIHDDNTFPLNSIELGLLAFALPPVDDVYLGGSTFGSSPTNSDIGVDIMPRLANSGNVPGSFGFTAPLGAGDYTIYVQQTATSNTPFGFNIGITAVPEPTAGAMLACLFGGMALCRRPRRSIS